MNKYAVILPLLLFSHWCFGGEAILIGQGLATSEPNYVELTIQIDSKCYSTPDQARKINDATARKIFDFLNAHIKTKDNYNTVISSGGYTTAYQNYYENKVLCPNTFQKQTTITFKTQDLTHFETLFNDIQNMVYKEFSIGAPSTIQTPVSYVTMADPMPSITNELQSQLEKKALALAYEDAKQKLYALLGKSSITNLKMTSASEVSPEEPGPIYKPRNEPLAMAANMKRAATPAPIQFQAQEFNKVIFFKFVFDDIHIQTGT